MTNSFALTAAQARDIMRHALAEGWAKWPEPCGPKPKDKSQACREDRDAQRRAAFIAAGLTWDGKARKRRPYQSKPKPNPSNPI